MKIISAIKNFLIINKIKKNIFKNDFKSYKQKEFEIIVCINFAYLNLIKSQSKVKNLDKSWKLERAYFLYYLINKIMEYEDFNVEYNLSQSLNDKLLNWLIYVYEKTYDKNDDKFLWEFDENRESFYDTFFTDDYLFLNRHDFENLPDQFLDILTFIFYYKPGNSNISLVDLASKQLNFDEWIINNDSAQIDVEYIVKPYFNFVYEKIVN